MYLEDRKKNLWIQNKVLDKLLEIKWFEPSKMVTSKALDLVQLHQERLKNFGLGQICPTELVKIWPGKKPHKLLELIEQSSNSTLQMCIDNTLQIIRDVAIDINCLAELDEITRAINNKMTGIIKEAAIKASGLTVKSTVAIRTLDSFNTKKIISDLDIVEKAVNKAITITQWYTFWIAVEYYITYKEKYLNPFEPLIDILHIGLWPIGVVKDKYVVLVPNRSEIKICQRI